MSVFAAFDAYQATVDADPAQVALARERRDVFVGALENAKGVVEVVKSGSLQRSTQLQPIHDVDLIVVFDTEEHSSWGQSGASSAQALEHVHDLVTSCLGTGSGSVDQLVRLALHANRNRAVKCFVDPPEQENAFTVDVMPVLRQSDGTLLVPSTTDERWSTADPEFLIEQVATRQREWSYFRPLVRVLKDWRLDVRVEGKIKSLVMEVLALECLPRQGNRPNALRSFFTSAAVRVNTGVSDPAGHCGLIQPDLDVEGLRSALEEAADMADLACDLSTRNDTDSALRVWQELFGSDFPAPPKKPKGGVAAAPAPLIKDAPQG
ncbi:MULTISPECIES: nucleotidyltransferase [unclassified Nocardia]|uniref:SMODS domain-containing nucleotidyltransferase n=1 Tax=unclassified Nocardia TaxID=2637762 RepID=UPI00278BED47|nr:MULTISPECIES: nucleotidyltransferase [unclassified Nocardia]